MGAAQVAADAAVMALKLLCGKDPGIPPGMGALVGPPVPWTCTVPGVPVGSAAENSDVFPFGSVAVAVMTRPGVKPTGTVTLIVASPSAESAALTAWRRLHAPGRQFALSKPSLSVETVNAGDGPKICAPAPSVSGVPSKSSVTWICLWPCAA